MLFANSKKVFSCRKLNTVIFPVAVVAVVALYLLNVFVNAIGLRGSDQYWYVGDLSMLEAAGSPVTNAIYPSSAALFSIDSLPPRIHNIPVTYLAGWVNKLGFVDFLSWIIVNTFLALAIACLLYLVARSLRIKLPFLAPIFFLCFPLTIWFTLNALAEMSLALGSVLIMSGTVLVSSMKRPVREVVLVSLFLVAAGVILMLYTRENFLLLVPAQVLFALWVCRNLGLRWTWALPSLVVTTLLIAIKPMILQPYPHAGLVSQLMAGTASEPGQMTSYYNLSQSSFSILEFIAKATRGLITGIVPSSAAELITESLILAVATAAIFLLRNDEGSRMLVFWSTVLLAIYLMTCAAFQPQNRYIFVLVPFVAIFIMGFLNRLWLWSQTSGRRTRRVTIQTGLGIIVLVVVCAAASILAARTYGSDARSAMVDSTALSAQLAKEPIGSILTVIEVSGALPLAYAAVPRPVLAVNPQVTSEVDSARMIVEWDVRVLVSTNRSNFDYLSRAVDLAYGGEAELVSQPKSDGLDTTSEFWAVER